MPKPAARLPIGRADCLILAAEQGTDVITAEDGTVYPLGSGTLTVLQGGESELYDADDSSAHVNNASLCTLFEAGNFRYLATGDAESSRRAASGRPLRQSPACHSVQGGTPWVVHLQQPKPSCRSVRPQAVAISCGLNNDYGHPHARCLAASDADVGCRDLPHRHRMGSHHFHLAKRYPQRGNCRHAGLPPTLRRTK